MKFRLYICFIFLFAFANISFASKCSSFQELRFADGSTGCMSDYKFFTIKRPPFAPDGLAELIYGKQSFSIAVNKNPNTCPIPWSAYHWGGSMRNTSSAALQAHGYRVLTSKPGHHQTIIQSLVHTIGIDSSTLITLDQLRKQRNVIDYSGDIVSDAMLGEAIKQAQALLGYVNAWITKKDDFLA
jgi:hypothetical protein